MMIEAMILGLSTGTYCTMYCGPVLIPFLCGTEKTGYKRNSGLICTFLVSRFAMYCLLGCIFAAMGYVVNEFFDPVLAHQLSVYAYIFCGASLLCNSLGVKFPWGCGETGGCKAPKLRRIGNDWVTAIITGLAVGLHICPPLWTAIIRSIFGGHGLSGLLYFVFFYIGTLPFFIPLFGMPFVAKRLPALRRVARVTQFLVSLYFLIFTGLIPLFFGY